MKSTRILFGTVAAACMTAVIVHGASTNTWVTGGSTYWGAGASWNPAGLPTNAATIGTCTTANAPDLQGSTTNKIRTLYLSGGSAYLNGNGPTVAGGLLTITGDAPGYPGVGFRTFNNYTEYIYANLALGMPNRTTEQIWSLQSRNAAGSAVYMNGKLSGTGRLHITGTLSIAQNNAGGVFYYLNQYDGATTGASFDGDTIIDMKNTVVFYPSNFTSSVNYRFGVSGAGGGTITLTSGSDTLNTGVAWRYAPISGTAAATSATLTNNFIISSMAGGEIGVQRGKALGTYTLPKVVYGGSLTLGGRMNIIVRSDNGSPKVPGADSTMDASAFVPFANGIIIDQSAATRASMRINRTGSIVDFPASITDSAGTYRNPFIVGTCDNQTRFNGANASFANGTVVSWCGRVFNSGGGRDLDDNVSTSRIDGNAASCFGTGALTVLPGGRVLLDVGGAMTSSQQVTLQGNTAALSVFGIPDDGSAAHLPSFASSSYGVLGLSGTSGTPFKNMMANGVGDNVSLGAGMAAGTFNGASLAAASDHVYRLGGGGRGNALTLDVSGTDNGCLTGPNAVQVNAPTYNGGGNVYILDSTNTFTGKLTVYSGLLNGGTSQLRGHARSLTPPSTPFGSAGGAVDLMGAQIRMYNALNNINAAVTKGATTFTSDSQVTLENGGAANTQTFTLATLTRSNNGVLVVQDASQPTRLALTHQVLVTTPGADLSAPANGMVPPYYIVNNGAYQFANYKPTGFTNVTYSANKLETPPGANDLVNQDVAVALTASRSCYALRTGAAITAQNPGDNWTVTIGSGGLILGADIGSMANTHVNVDFGGKEAVVYCTANSTLYGVLSNTGGNGLTKSGSGALVITNLNNSFTGPITVNRGYLYYTPDKDDNTAPGSLGPVTNPIYMNGGYMLRQVTGLSPAGYRTLSASRTITLGPLGGGLSGNANPGYATVTVKSRITGAGVLLITGGFESAVIDNANNDYSGGTLISTANANNGVTATGKLGQGPVVMLGDWYTQTQFYFSGDDNLHYVGSPDKYLPMQVSSACFAYFRSAAPAMGSLTGEGDVVLGNATGPVDTTLTVGKDNADATFYGFLSQVVGRTCSLVKDGTGTWNLYGAQSYSGQTTVTNGTLNLMGSLKGACNVGPAGAISGLGLVSGGLTLNGGTFAVQLSANTPVLQVTGGLNIKAGSKLSLSFAPGFNPGMQQITVLTTTTGITTPGNLTVVTGGITARAVGNNLVVSRAAGTVLEVR